MAHCDYNSAKCTITYALFWCKQVFLLALTIGDKFTAYQWLSVITFLLA